MGPISLIVLIIAAVLFSAGGILVGKLFTKGSPTRKKASLMNAVFLL